jgi:hypothetical protein
MARQSDEFSLAWSSLSGGDEETGWRTIPITPAGRCALSAGRRFPGNEEALLAGFSTATVPPAEKLPGGQGFNIERVDPHKDGKTWLALTRKASGSTDLFLAMVCDVAGALDAEAGADEARLVRLFLGRVRAWQEFMLKGALALSPEAEIGLIGELVFLAKLIDAGIPPLAAVEAWEGPLDGLQDFVIGTGGVEVKTTLASKGFPAKIGSLEQLDDSVRKPLFVAGERLSQVMEGRNLPDFVADVWSALAGESAAQTLFTHKLLAAGYVGAYADRYPRRFTQSESKVIEVDEGFPRITRGTAPQGVSRAVYEIDLDRATGRQFGTTEALKKLGVI